MSGKLKLVAVVNQDLTFNLDVESKCTTGQLAVLVNLLKDTITQLESKDEVKIASEEYKKIYDLEKQVKTIAYEKINKEK